MKRKKRVIKLILALAALLFVAGCGKVSGADALIKKAKSEHGDCSVISKEETGERTVVVLKDELQGFEYKVGSGKSDVVIDGSNFGSVANDYDTFNVELRKYTMSQVQDELDSTCKKYNMTYEEVLDKVLIRLQFPSTLSDDDAIKAAKEIAGLFQKYNVNHRLDGYEIYIAHDYEWFKSVYGTYNPGHNDYPDETYSSSGISQACYFGHVNLPDCEYSLEEDLQ